VNEPVDLREEFEALLQEAFSLSPAAGNGAEDILRLGLERPLSREEAQRALTTLLTTLRANGAVQGDPSAMADLRDAEAFVEKVIQLREQVNSEQGGISGALPADATAILTLQDRSNTKVGAVHPTPIYLGRRVPMMQGFVRTHDVELWDDNERLDIHTKQFEQQAGREPTAGEVLDIMLSNLKLIGVDDEDHDDQFRIRPLARSIAANGVQKPPIIDVDGTLLDGNRRVAASKHILANPNEFDAAERDRVDWLFVWQLTEHATDEDREAVMMSLNFEPDFKEEWPDYIKARKIYDRWQSLLAALPRTPGPKEQAKMKRELSKQFGLGPDTTTVNRYLNMMAWALEFEDHHLAKNRRDVFEVQHRASKYFQYFDELQKGRGTGGVAFALSQDDQLRQTVFDLLYDGKFRRFSQIRDLKHVLSDGDAFELLKKAKESTDTEEAQDQVEDALSIARARRAETRMLGANSRIEAFTSWLEDLPVKAFRDQITPKNLRRLLRSLELVRVQAEEVLGDDAAVGAHD
jgi:hypothetical protein